MRLFLTAVRALHREGVQARERGNVGYVRAVTASGLMMVVLMVIDPIGFVEELRDEARDP